MKFHIITTLSIVLFLAVVALFPVQFGYFCVWAVVVSLIGSVYWTVHQCIQVLFNK